MNYTVVIEETPTQLAVSVNSFIAEGWEPIGGVAVMSDRHSYTNERKGYEESDYSETWAQALVKRS